MPKTGKNPPEFRVSNNITHNFRLQKMTQRGRKMVLYTIIIKLSNTVQHRVDKTYGG